ncbi:phytanoyl-CoA dioxygenase family protein [Alkanindiges sp. WGS2144]|uniref:phytanoyl-CoA dioxygenase family protein n=1 Tax=Alkanindiges sp. WGS2144 TaxID=3366808 RepID=UPI0037526EE8
MGSGEYYAQQGYEVLPAFFSQHDIAQLRQIVAPIYQQWLTGNQHMAGFDQLVNMHSLTHPQYFKHQPELRLKFFNLLSPAKLVEFLKAQFGSAVYFHNTQLFFNPKDKNRQNYWHRDMQYSPISDSEQARVHKELLSLHVRIPLLAETGIELIPHSHQQWDSRLEHQVRFAKEGHQQHDDLPHSQLITLQPGDALIFNAQMIHRGRYDLNRERLALDLCIGKLHPLIQGFMDKAVQPTVDELARIKNKNWFVEAAKLFK